MNARSRLLAFTAIAAVALLGFGCTTDPVKPTAVASKQATARFVGSQTCGACHQDAYKAWQGTYHSKMVLPVKQGLLKDALDNWAKDSKGNAGPTKANVTSTPAKLDDVVYVIGTKWKQRYLVKNPNTGNHQFLDKQWNRGSGLWEPYGQKNDWETQCATCHTTGFRVTGYDPAKPAAQKNAFQELGIGCEACHGPGSAHASSRSKADIFNPRNAASKGEADKVCGYCHIRIENYNYKTAQDHAAEHLPHPQQGQSFKAGIDDWTKWYPDKVLLVGVQPEDPVTKNWPNTDLNNAFFVDEAAQKSGYFEARKHHQEYQEHLQSKHGKNGLLGCMDCHSPHPAGGKKPVAGENCKTCHGPSMDYKTAMPGTAQTAGGLFVRSHAFNPNPRKGGMTGDQLPPPVFAYPQK